MKHSRGKPKKWEWAAIAGLTLGGLLLRFPAVPEPLRERLAVILFSSGVLLAVIALWSWDRFQDLPFEEQKELEEKELEAQFGSFTKFPDLLLMDGGRGQVNIALQVLKELHLEIPVCGMVKDDNHNTRGLYYNNREIQIDRNSEGFKLITRVQDEAHRFAIEYHRSLRSKAQVKSVLDEIPGVGPSRRKALMRRFKSIEEVMNADVDTLAGVDEIPVSVARGIYDFFRRDDFHKDHPSPESPPSQGGDY